MIMLVKGINKLLSEHPGRERDNANFIDVRMTMDSVTE